MSSKVQIAPRPFLTKDLFTKFDTHCGACHVLSTRPDAFDGKPITPENFAEMIDEDALARIMENDPKKVMPPPENGGRLWKDQPADAPIRELVSLLEKWIQAGKPSDFFEVPVLTTECRPYQFPALVGQAMTNIGDCVPESDLVGSEADSEKNRQLDEMFASVTKLLDLPKDLTGTDLFTFDSAELAKQRTVAFAPAYPLWSDDAGKLRHVRVPRGTSIRYNAQTREFEIPPNTRFYKTFLKKVIDSEGRETHRKIETRLIIARPDDCSTQPCKVKAIMAAYKWDLDDEARGASLVQETLRNGQPFVDQLFTYLTDEKKHRSLKEQGKLNEETLASVTRHYAIPGSQRCVECHMGSPSQSGILGFTPLQIQRWPYIPEPYMLARGEYLKGFGILEEHAPGPDESTQLQRLIDYRIVTGLDSPNELVPLSLSQGSRWPRNGYELKAQGYMLGNCAHCHNPRGFASIQNPALTDLLNFYPGNPVGGIFQFSLENYSPRTKRTATLDKRIPYITPSLFDFAFRRVGEPARKHYNSPKGLMPVEAPWRSFIYRNVETPFTYSEDFALFPHMPRNTAGFDCRAPQIMGDWMVSVPSRLKKISVEGAEITEEQPYEAVPPGSPDFEESVQNALLRLDVFHQGERYNRCPDTSDIVDPKPVESVPGDLKPDQFPDWAPINQEDTGFFDGLPDRAHWVIADDTEVPGDWVPRRADWKDLLLHPEPTTIDGIDEVEGLALSALRGVRITDQLRAFATQSMPFGFWMERVECASRLSFQQTLQKHFGRGEPPPEWTLNPQAPLEPLLKRPKTVWDPAEVPAALVDPSNYARPLYSLSPGAAVFQAICINCHGTQANGDSQNAGTIRDITGGKVRVANLRDGIFGPPGSPGAARQRVFTEEAAKLSALGGEKITADDLAARYLAWMALGGTKSHIPEAVVNTIAKQSVLGEPRDSGIQFVSPNMLEAARLFCLATLPAGVGSVRQSDFNVLFGPAAPHLPPPASNPRLAELIPTNGDRSLWQKLCALGRPPPIRVITFGTIKNPWSWAIRVRTEHFRPPGQNEEIAYDFPEILDPEKYGEAPVITVSTMVYEPLESLYPAETGSKPIRRTVVKSARALDSLKEPVAWCIARPDAERPATTEDQAALEAFMTDAARTRVLDGQALPYCPDNWKSMRWTPEQINRWALEGAINAGLAGFVYLDQVAKDPSKRAVQYNECDQLP